MYIESICKKLDVRKVLNRQACPNTNSKPMYRGVDKSLARPGRKQANVSVRMASISFGVLHCRQKKKNLMTARVSMLLKSCAILTCFRACFPPGRAKDLSAPGLYMIIKVKHKFRPRTGREGPDGE